MSRKTNYVINTIAVVLTLLLFKAISSLIPDFKTDNYFINNLLSYLASVGFYITSFQILQWVYYNYLEDIINPKLAFKGEWFFKITVNKHTNTPRYGILKMYKQNNQLHFNTVHFDPSLKDFTVTLSSEEIFLHKREMIILYNTIGHEQKRFYRRGIIYLTILGIPAYQLKGVWTDCLSNGDEFMYDGEIELKKRDKETDEILKALGYPESRLNAQ